MPCARGNSFMSGSVMPVLGGLVANGGLDLEDAVANVVGHGAGSSPVARVERRGLSTFVAPLLSGSLLVVLLVVLVFGLLCGVSGHGTGCISSALVGAGRNRATLVGRHGLFTSATFLRSVARHADGKTLRVSTVLRRMPVAGILWLGLWRACNNKSISMTDL